MDKYSTVFIGNKISCFNCVICVKFDFSGRKLKTGNDDIFYFAFFILYIECKGYTTA